MPPDITIRLNPETKRINMSVSNVFTIFILLLNSFQMNTPHRAAIIGAPCPKA